MKYRAVKGVQDIMPPEVFLWQKVETIARDVFREYGYRELRAPIMEFTTLFTRSIGETTDIVEKEMYTFEDRAGRSITLRPEGTAPVVRAYVQNHLHTIPKPQKFFYIGPMFRYERPQKGRFRQFHQVGVEAFGEESSRIDAEMLDMLRLFLKRVGISNLTFEINSIGCSICRPSYRTALSGFLNQKQDALCTDCRRRSETNPLRVLDCKVESCRKAIIETPRITDFLCEDCSDHFQSLMKDIGQLGIHFRTNHNMVRGLDYYTRTTFEVTSDQLGAQNTVAAGGRYDRLVEEFGGPSTPAIGFAIGIERLVSLMKEQKGIEERTPDLFIATIGEDASEEGFRLASGLRSRGIWVEIDYSGASLKSQFRKADKLKAEYVFIIGGDELSKGTVRYKRFSDGKEGEINRGDIYSFFTNPNFSNNRDT